MSRGPSLGLLLAPRLLAARHALQQSALKAIVLVAITAAFWAGCFIFFTHILEFFQTVTALGPLLTQRLLGMILVSFFAILIISNIVTALTTFYLANDVRFLLPAPISRRRLHQARFTETLVASSWMVLLFGLPVFLAYGVVYQAGPLFYGAVLATMLPLLVLCAALGVIITTALVLVFPARRTRDALVVITVALVAGGYMALRLLQPERLAEPSEMAGFVAFLTSFEAPSSPYLPTTWAAEVLIPLLGQRSGEPLFYLGMLVTTAAVAYVASASLVARLYLKAWSRAQEGEVRSGGRRRLAAWLRPLAAPLPRASGLLLVKDLTVFFRDPSQWSQLLLLLALVVVYIYNFSALPVDDGTPLAATLREVVAFANLALAAFVTAAVAVRFVYPVVSLEGRAWWVLRSAPLSLRTLWWSKFWIAFLPLAALGEILIVVTGRFLGVAPEQTVLFMVTLVLLIAAIVSLGLAFGAAYPRLDTRNAAQIATGFGGVIYMVACLALITVVVALEAWPVSRLFWHQFAPFPVTTSEQAAIGIAFAGVAMVTLITWAVARQMAIRRFARLG